MPRTLITGMSATGKSSVIAVLNGRGHHAVDLDTDEWSHLVPDDSPYADPTATQPLDWRWRDDRVHALLTAEQASVFVAGTSTQQAMFYPLLDHLVLLTVSEEVALRRLATRDTSDYGKDPAELRRELELRPVVEPALRRSACLEIDTSTRSQVDVAGIIERHAADNSFASCSWRQ